MEAVNDNIKHEYIGHFNRFHHDKFDRCQIKIFDNLIEAFVHHRIPSKYFWKFDNLIEAVVHHRIPPKYAAIIPKFKTPQSFEELLRFDEKTKFSWKNDAFLKRCKIFQYHWSRCFSSPNIAQMVPYTMHIKILKALKPLMWNNNFTEVIIFKNYVWHPPSVHNFRVMLSRMK